jgi:regulator of protease activity HflC (stomatin/prohibitin superfamily)
MISILFIIALVMILGGIAFVVMFRTPEDDENTRYRQSTREERGAIQKLSVALAIVGAFIMALASVSIIETGKAGVVRVAGVVQQEALGEGVNIVSPWATVTRQETRGFQFDQTGENAMEVLTSNGTKFTIELGIPFKFNPAAAAMVESRIQDGDWQSEVISIARGTVRTNVSGYQTFGEFNTRRATAVDGVLYGNEVASQITANINELFCTTYDICEIDAVRVGDLIVRKVRPPAAITAEAAALEAAKLSQQTEQALNEVEAIRAMRRSQEGTGYGNLFSFLPAGSSLSASEAANFLRASADKTRADAEAYMQRQLADGITDAMSKGNPIPSIIVSTGGVTPTPIFNPGGSQ